VTDIEVSRATALHRLRQDPHLRQRTAPRRCRCHQRLNHALAEHVRHCPATG
jgi:hypothetical protein